MSAGRRALLVALSCLVALLALGLVLWPRLSARLLGDEYRVAVGPVDPVDPFRGAYVALGYPTLPLDGPPPDTGQDDGEAGDVFLPLVRDGDLWRGTDVVRERPPAGPYLACDADGQVTCGIESFFASQVEARRLEDLAGSGEAVAVLRVDDRGNAAVVGLAQR